MADLVVRNARLIDGSGAPAADGDVAVEGDRIAEVGELEIDDRSNAAILEDELARPRVSLDEYWMRRRRDAEKSG